MKYTKPPLTIADQVALLQSRGMGGDPARIARRLKVVNYYRLSGYWHPFVQPNNSFKTGTHIDEVWDRYMFDRKLRLLVMDAIERIEVSVRTQVAYHHAMIHGPFGYCTRPANLPDARTFNYNDLVAKLFNEVKRSKEPFIVHFETKYGDEHMLPPIWMVAEVISLGTTLTLYRKCEKHIRKKVAAEFGVGEVVFESWLLTLNTVRNICAHHSRLWNRELGTRPKIPFAQADPTWHDPFSISPDRIFAALSICRHIMTRIAPNSKWARRVVALIDAHPTIPIISMGMPTNWRAHALWRGL